MPFIIIIGALIIGLMLGLMGSGGSILTVPVLVYLLGHDGKVAIAESLAIVGSIALVTMLPYARAHQVNWRSVLFFGVPGIVGTYAGAWLSHFVPAAAQLTLFAVVMLIASLVMFRKSKSRPVEPEEGGPGSGTSQSFPAIALEGLMVGMLTGLVGVGGGFLIVPALVVLGNMPMRVAIGTSLALISINSFSGFYKYLEVLHSIGASVNWETVGIFIVIGIVGSLAGHAIATRLNQAVLRKGFAIFLVAMGLFVLGKEGPKLWATPPTKHDSAAARVGQPVVAEGRPLVWPTSSRVGSGVGPALARKTPEPSSEDFVERNRGSETAEYPDRDVTKLPEEFLQ